MTITKKGYELATKLSPGFGYTDSIAETCSRICRAAATLHRLNEDDCNGHPCQSSPFVDSTTANKLQARWEARVERETAKVAKRLETLVYSLPEVDWFGHWALVAESDPRGCSLIVAPAGSELRGDSWGDEHGLCVPR